MYKGKTYSSCTIVDDTKPWCATTTQNGQMKKWEHCTCEPGCCLGAATPPPPPPTTPPPPVHTLPQWKQGLIRNGIKAQAFIQTTLNKMGARSIGSTVLEYYGKNDAFTRTEIKRALNGVKDMLSNVEYINQGATGGSCGGSTLAYVSSWMTSTGRISQRTCGAACNNGAYVINICQHYFTFDDFTKVGTIIHEGAHHMAMDLDDVQFEGVTAYGRSICRRMALKCNHGDSAACTKCVRNADSLEYLAEDVNGAR